jgi:hypothetical protein
VAPKPQPLFLTRPPKPVAEMTRDEVEAYAKQVVDAINKKVVSPRREG